MVDGWIKGGGKGKEEGGVVRRRGGWGKGRGAGAGVDDHLYTYRRQTHTIAHTDRHTDTPTQTSTQTPTPTDRETDRQTDRQTRTWLVGEGQLGHALDLGVEVLPRVEDVRVVVHLEVVCGVFLVWGWVG